MRETLAAKLAGVRLLARVHAQVQLQRRRVGEGSSANLARISATRSGPKRSAAANGTNERGDFGGINTALF